MTTLYFVNPDCPNTQQTLIAAEFVQLALPTQPIAKKYDPLLLLTPQGTLNQPTTILQYIAGEALGGKNPQQKLQSWQWFEHFHLELLPVLAELQGQIAGVRPSSREKYDYAVKELMRLLQGLNSHLKMRTFMVGDAVTLVDISLATQLQTVFRTVISEDNRKKLPNLTRWFTYVRSTGPFLKVLGPVLLCGKQVFGLLEQKVDPKKE